MSQMLFAGSESRKLLYFRNAVWKDRSYLHPHCLHTGTAACGTPAARRNAGIDRYEHTSPVAGCEVPDPSLKSS